MRNAHFTAITLGHITFSLSYVTVVVQSRLAPKDRSVEQATMDLGSTRALAPLLLLAKEMLKNPGCG